MEFVKSSETLETSSSNDGTGAQSEVSEDVVDVGVKANADKNTEQDHGNEEEEDGETDTIDASDVSQSGTEVSEGTDLSGFDSMKQDAHIEDVENLQNQVKELNLSLLGNENGDGTDSDRSMNNSSRKNPGKKAMNLLGLDHEDQIFRAKALMKMGLTEDDMYNSGPLFKTKEEHQRQVKVFEQRGYTEKVPRVTGYTEEQILRKKAIDTLGVSEEDIDIDRAKRLASMGSEISSPPSQKSGPNCINSKTSSSSSG